MVHTDWFSAEAVADIRTSATSSTQAHVQVAPSHPALNALFFSLTSFFNDTLFITTMSSNPKLTSLDIVYYNSNPELLMLCVYYVVGNIFHGK